MATRDGKRGNTRGQQQRVEPDGRVRLSQAITTYGAGSLVDLVHHAVIVGGLDFWEYDGRGATIAEPRLRDILAQQLLQHGRRLRIENPFLLPPIGDERDPHRSNGIQAQEFPQWFVCQNPTCRALVRSNGLTTIAGRYHHACDSKKKPIATVPVRFVMACPRGHVEDFPWIGFVHGLNRVPICSAPSLSLHEGKTGDFGEIRVDCACGASRPLSNAAAREANPTCGGHRPWLGSDGQESDCTEKLKMLVRTASNSYFAQVVSALSIPEAAFGLRDAVKARWRDLSSATVENLPWFRQMASIGDSLAPYRDDEVLQAIDDIKNDREPPRDPLRTAEFKQFIGAGVHRPGDLPPPKGSDHVFFARALKPEGGYPKGIARIVLAHRLREVRVQIGLTRLEAPSPDLQGEYDLGVETAPVGLNTDWLPAAEIHGEGIFIQLDEAAVCEWERRPDVIRRGRELLAGFDAWNNHRNTKSPFPGTRYYLLHSLSHVLMSALSLECGYSASSLSERIYCAPATDGTPMAALLISTGSPGSEGTLGGLVEQGRHIAEHLRRAWDFGTLCSNDPVCASHTPAGDLAERYLEGAACHGCLFVAECSCERFNQFLDRALVVPIIGQTQGAFFKVRP